MNNLLIFYQYTETKLAAWKSAKSREKSGKMIMRKKWPPWMKLHLLKNLDTLNFTLESPLTRKFYSSVMQ